MLEVILMGFIGRSFHELAGEYSKNQWLYAILGVVSVYVGLIISGLIMAIGVDIISPGSLDTINETVLGLMAIPFALILTWLFYRYLESSWKKGRIIDNADILDDEFVDP